jgi:hypothetical protein
MRTIQDFKSMAKTLREDLAAKNLAMGHSECLELVAHQSGFPDWNTLASKFDEAAHLPTSLQASSDTERLPPIDAKRLGDRYLLVPRSTSPSIDVVFMINLLRDNRLIAMPCLAGKFGHVSAIEIEDLLRVSCVADAPDEGGTSLTKVAISVFAEGGWSVPEKLSGRMQLSDTPSFENSIAETPFRVEIRPRRVIWGPPGTISVSSKLEDHERRAAMARIDSAKREATSDAANEMLLRPFQVSIYEIRQNFVVAERFTGVYKRTVTLSDGTPCDIELTPTIYDGRKLVKAQFPGNNDPRYYNYIGLNGSAQRGSLMVQVRDLRTQQKLWELEKVAL